MKSSIIILSTLVVLANLFFTKNDIGNATTEIIAHPTRSVFENEIIKPIYDSEILVHAIEKKLMN